MTFKIMCTAGRNYLILNGYKYREANTLSDGKINWRCCAKLCSSTVKTDSEKKKIILQKTTHNHKPQCASPTVTPTSARTTPSTSTPTPHNSTPTELLSSPSTPVTTITASPATTPCDITPDTPPTLPQSPSLLLAENLALNKKVLELQAEVEVLLNHSIESDQRLLKYTDQVFAADPATDPKHLSPNPFSLDELINNLKTENTNQSETINLNIQYIKELEAKITELESPCQRCIILKEESCSMLQSIRTLEGEVKRLSGEQQKVTTATPYIKTHNSFTVLHNLIETDDSFTVATKKKIKLKPKKSTKKSNEKVRNKSHENFDVNKRKQSLPFKSVSIFGDSHARHLAGLMKETVDHRTHISGFCKPGASLLHTIPDIAPPPDNCFILISGNNDVTDGRQAIIFRHIEDIIKKCSKTSKVLITPLLPRHDLAPGSPVHNIIRLANAYISELCVRSEGVELLEIGGIGREHFTAHGQHLREKGKRLLTSLMTAKLASMTPMPHHRLATPADPVDLSDSRPSSPDSSSVTTPSQETPKQPRTLPFENYAEAVKINLNQENRTSFLGNPLLAPVQN